MKNSLKRMIKALAATIRKTLTTSIKGKNLTNVIY